jgi:hypothetical protein
VQSAALGAWEIYVKGKTGLRDVVASDVKTYFDRIWELRCEELGEAAFGGPTVPTT